jgi:uncharacterized protein (TIGR02646 family)
VIRILPVPPAPAVLTTSDSDAAREVRAAEDYIEKNGSLKGFEFTAYKHPDVLKTLEEIFGGKCAYCEFRYAAGSPADIEHYRPKGGVVIGSQRVEPGYYWLAAEWTNLLPSCPDCNRSRYHKFDDDTEEKRGKANQFPIANDPRTLKPGCETNEERLLLHPYFDDPAEYLRYVSKGVIQAVPDAAGIAKRKGLTSIQVYGLDRPRLTELRADVWIRIERMVARAQRDMLDASESPDDLAAFARMKESLEDLRLELSSRAMFLAMIRQLTAAISVAIAEEA